MTDYKCKSPILFITFTKENETKRVFETIREAKPSKLYIASDGARAQKQGEKEKVEKLRKWLISSVDWNCEVKTKFNEKNLGCGRGVASAISWFFENEEKGIIIEDDVQVLDISFFRFCDEMLDRYKDDDKIGQIGCLNTIDKELLSNEYFLSKFTQCWGWATWRRAWTDYDFTISLWKKLKHTDFIYKVFPKQYVSKHFSEIFDKTYESQGEALNTWDYQWLFCNLVKNRLTIVPRCNLVTNIGFVEDAIHASLEVSPHIQNLPCGKMQFPLKHQQSYDVDIARDDVITNAHCKPESLFRKFARKSRNALKKIQNKIAIGRKHL